MLQHCIIPNTKGLSYVVTFLSWMHVFEWHMAGLYLKMDNKKALVTNKKNRHILVLLLAQVGGPM